MKKLSAILFISVLGMGVNAQTAVIATNTGTSSTTASTIPASEGVLGLQETEFDFGKIPQGKPVTHVFEITNMGKDSLHIENIQASCGCTTPDWERDKKQAPGEKTKITVGYNAATEGPFTKQISITYNGAQTKQLVIKGEVWKTPATSAPENKALSSLKD